MSQTSQEIQVPSGFSFLSKTVGIKASGSPDFALIFADAPCSASAVFTQSHFCGECIPIGRETVKSRQLQAIFVNSGVANVATGNEGRENVLKTITAFSDELQIDKNLILMSSTGKIGPQLPIEKILSGIHGSKNELKSGKDAAIAFGEAILTTDTRRKIRSTQFQTNDGETVTVFGVAKGSGMIEPNMATMLSYILTDAQIEKTKVHAVLENAVSQSFNAISVDTDTSTSDTVALMASGKVKNVDLDELQSAINFVALELAKDIIKDGEGATKLIEAQVEGAMSQTDAKLIAKSIVNSPLVKTAVYGKDPNWGRIAMAIGKCFSANVDKNKVKIYYGDHLIFDCGEEKTDNLEKIAKYLENSEIIIKVQLNLSNSNFIAYGCDLTEEYIHINADYST